MTTRAGRQTDFFWKAQVIITLITCLQVTGVAWISYLSKQKVDETQEKIVQVVEKVEEIHKSTNSMKDALVKTTGEEAYARGVKVQKEKEDDKDTKGK